MKIMSFNTQHCLNYIERKIDFSLMADTIRSLDPDVVGLNEMRGKGEDPEYTDQTGALQALTGYPYAFFAKALDVGGVNPYGNALLSKIPIEQAEVIPIPTPKIEGRVEPRCILKARLAGGITVLVSHFGLTPTERENAVRTVLSEKTEEKCILMGDFNAPPDDTVLNPIRACMKDTADTFEGPRLSFRSDEPHVKIDYIFVTPDIEVRSADIPAIVASDHRPHIANIAIGHSAK